MSLLSRLEKIEQSIVKADRRARGLQYFYTYDEQTYYQRESAAHAAKDNAFKIRQIDYRNACAGAGGDPGPDDKAYTKEDIDRIAAEGWQIIVIHWVDMGVTAQV